MDAARDGDVGRQPLGVLGKAVARVTAPLVTADPTYRDLYYGDVERHIEQTGVELSPRLSVDPDAYLARLRREARAQEEMIVKDGIILFKFFFSDPVFIHQLVELAAADTGCPGGFADLAFMAGQNIF